MESILLGNRSWKYKFSGTNFGRPVNLFCGPPLFDLCITIVTVQKMKFSIKDFFSKCDEIHTKLQIWLHLLKKSLMENFIFCAVCILICVITVLILGHPVLIREKEISTIDTMWKVSKYGNFSGPYFPAFGLNTERYFVSLHIQSKFKKIRTRKTPYLDTIHAVIDL